MFGMKKLAKRVEVLERDVALAAEKIAYLDRKLSVRTKQLYQLQKAVEFIVAEE